MSNQFGIDLSKLEHTAPKKFNIIKTVPGRVVHIDADFLAYQVAYDDEKTFSEMCHNCDVSVEKMRLMAGAEKAVLHLTPKGSSKGGRYEFALLKEYQAARKDKPKPKFLHQMREWMHKERGAILHMNCEADDGMAMAQYEAIRNGQTNLSIIATKDKDLCMVPGLQLNWDSGEITDTETEFGFINLHTMDNKSKTKKVKGRGWKFFWAQMLMGDPTDNIQGLPKVCHADYCPTGKPKAVGPVLTYDILSGVDNNKQAYEAVRDLFKEYGEKIGFTNYRDGTPVQFGHALQSEAQLTWMRRYDDPYDAIKWMKEHCL